MVKGLYNFLNNMDTQRLHMHVLFFYTLTMFLIHTVRISYKSYWFE